MFVSVVKNLKVANFHIFFRHYSRLSVAFLLQKQHLKFNYTILENCSPVFSKQLAFSPKFFFLERHRYYAKRKKPSKQKVEEKDESDEEDEDFESLEPEEMGDTFNLVTKSVPSLRIDSIVKAGLKITKKKVEKEFYANRIRLNEQKVLKKAAAVHPEDEVDLIKGFSPENQKFLLVDRIVIKSIGKVTGTGNYPVTMQVFKELTIENYPDPWSKMDVLTDD